MNIALEDVMYLEKKYGEEASSGEVRRLAQNGYTFVEIYIEMEVQKRIKPLMKVVDHLVNYEDSAARYAAAKIKDKQRNGGEGDED